MKMIACIEWTLVGLLFLLIVNAVGAEDKEEQLLDSLIGDDPIKSKRPFCNAFTGCGKKRSYNDNSLERQDSGELITVRLPVFIYRALLRLATREIRNAVEHSSAIENSPSTDAMMPGYYSSSFPSSQKFPIRKRYES